MDLVEFSKAVLGEHPADVEKGFAEVAHGAKMYGREVKRGYKTARRELKGARAEAGYQTGWAGQKEAFRAGLNRKGKMYRSGIKEANKVGRARTMRKLTEQPKPVSSGFNFELPPTGELTGMTRASMRRSLALQKPLRIDGR